MHTSTSGLSHVKLFDSLEARRYMANPVVVDFAVDSADAYAGKEVTLTAHVSDDLGVRAVVFWVEDNQDALNRFIFNSFDQPLGDVFTHDAGVPGQYSLRVRVGASWKASTKFGVDVVDSDGNYSQAPINFVTVDTRAKPYVLGLRAETLSGGDIHLIATTSTDGEHVTSTGIGGVTFFLDQNGNNRWDFGADIDLGVGMNVGGGSFEMTVTPQIGWNTTWIAASAFDTRSNADRFGPNHSTVPRGDVSPPLISQFDIIPPDFDTNGAVFTSNETVRFYAEFSASQGALGATMFHDRNRNGLWDAGIDTALLQYFPTGNPSTSFFDLTILLGQLGHGFQAVGIAVHDNSGRGDDSWSAVTTLWINIDNTPWITDASISPSPVPLGTATSTFTFRVHDDDGVMGVRRAKITRYFTGGGFGDTGIEGTSLIYLMPGRTNAVWRMSFDTHSLAAGNYSIDISLQDYRELRGPLTRVMFTVV